jgi:hypothetical protein
MQTVGRRVQFPTAFFGAYSSVVEQQSKITTIAYSLNLHYPVDGEDESYFSWGDEVDGSNPSAPTKLGCSSVAERGVISYRLFLNRFLVDGEERGYFYY